MGGGMGGMGGGYGSYGDNGGMGGLGMGGMGGMGMGGMGAMGGMGSYGGFGGMGMMGMGGYGGMMGMAGYPAASDPSCAPASTEAGATASNYAAAAAALGMPDPSTMVGGGMMQGDLGQQMMAMQQMPQHQGQLGVTALNESSYGNLPINDAQLRQQIAISAESGFERTTGDWPLLTERVGAKIRSLESTPGNVRHDILVEKQRVGRLIGPQGSTLKALLANTQCEIFVMDK
ncbi:MAG: hypothetical protein SGPRY_010697, partial [Prymnesium sp.]